VPGFYWSASTNAGNPGFAWIVYFFNGSSNFDFKARNGTYVRAVRSGL
jgi:hypothetical protein